MRCQLLWDCCSLVVSNPDSVTEVAKSTESSKVNFSILVWFNSSYLACIFINHILQLSTLAEITFKYMKYLKQFDGNIFCFHKHSVRFPDRETTGETPQTKHVWGRSGRTCVFKAVYLELHSIVLYVTLQASPPVFSARNWSLIYEQDHRNSSAIASGCLWNKSNISDSGKY